MGFTFKPLPNADEFSVGGVGWRGLLHHSLSGLAYPWCLVYRFCEDGPDTWKVQLFRDQESAVQFMDGLDADEFGGRVGDK